MFSVIINYSQQVTEDSWERRFKSVNMNIPELEKELSGYDSLGNPRVVDVQPVNSEIIGTQPTSSNSDYTAALHSELMQWNISEDLVIDESLISKLATRLSSVVKAQQNCV